MLNYDLYYMKQALIEAKKALVYDEVPVGAIIVHNGKIIAKSSAQLAVTEHPIDENRCTVVALNYNIAASYTVTVKDGWALEAVEYGKVEQIDPGQIRLSPAQNAICRFVLKKL